MDVSALPRELVLSSPRRWQFDDVEPDGCLRPVQGVGGDALVLPSVLLGEPADHQPHAHPVQAVPLAHAVLGAAAGKQPVKRTS